jgi:protein CpxP
MKKLLVICGLLFGVVAFANAQQGGGQGGQRPGGGGRMGGGTPEERVKQLEEKIKLTDDQKAKVTAVYAEAAEAQKKMREEMQGGGDRQAMMEKMTKMNEATDTKLNAIFTAEQKTAYKAWQDEQKAAREKMMRERQGGGGR